MTLSEILKTHAIKDAKFAILTNVSIDSGKAAQSNKFYAIFEQSNGTIKIVRGRIDSSFTIEPKTPPIHEWDKIIKGKTQRKVDAYTNVTHLFQEAIDATPIQANGKATKFADIADHTVKTLFDTLQSYANKSIQKNYTIEAKAVTETMVNEAQTVVDSIAKKLKIKGDLTDINNELMKLYRIIPRKMQNVRDHLFVSVTTQKDLDVAQNKLADEQATLDVMAGQVAQLKAEKAAIDPSKKEVKKALNMLEVMGLEITPVTDAKIIEMIKDKMNDLKRRGQQDNSKIFKQAFQVTNKKTQATFDAHLKSTKNKQCELFWHGSRNANYLSIAEKGLLIRPSGAGYNGSAFGDGIYFAQHSGKSLNYSDYRGSYRSYTGGNSSQAFLLLFDVNVGKQKIVTSGGNYNLKQLESEGCDSTWAKATSSSYISYDEYIIYRASQCTIKYLIEIQ